MAKNSYCKECNRTYPHYNYTKHLKTKKHKRNVARFNSPNTDSTLSRYYSNSSAPQSTVPNYTGETDVDRHAAHFLSSMSKLVDMYYAEYNLDATSTGTDIRVSISISKVDVK